jgi:hypothetical protein
MVTSGLAGALLASVLAQAELAPPEPPSPPAPGAPAAGPAAPPTTPNAMSVHARFAYRPGDSVGPAPAAGFSFGLAFERAYLRLGDTLALGVGVDFFYDHFARDVENVTVQQQLLSQTSFVALQTFAAELGVVRPWLGAGAGMSMAYFAGSTSDGLLPTSARHAQPLLRGALGLDVPVARGKAVVVRADFTHPLTSPAVPTYSYSPFGDLFDVGVGFQARF